MQDDMRASASPFRDEVDAINSIISGTLCFHFHESLLFLEILLFRYLNVLHSRSRIYVHCALNNASLTFLSSTRPPPNTQDAERMAVHEEGSTQFVNPFFRLSGRATEL